MRVVLSTISKFHTFDLARQMERLGVLERLFTGRPRWKLKGENLPLQKVSTYPIFQTLYEGFGHLGIRNYPLKTDLNWLSHWTFDKHVARHLTDCDLFHALSYCGLESGQTAQRRGAKWVCDAVNTHLNFQDDMLAEEYERVGLSYGRQETRFLQYAAESYELADLITIPSNFVKETFISQGIDEKKLDVIPYGVDLNLFYPTSRPDDNVFRILFVGQMSIRKGIHDLLEAMCLAALPNSKLTFVGSIQPETEILLRRASSLSVELVGPQPKYKLPIYYSHADVLVLPSVEEGLAYVIGEAMACGCPVIATVNTGARDFYSNEIEGFIVPIRSPQTIAEKLTWLYEHPNERAAMRLAALHCVKKIGGWASYGDHIHNTFKHLVAAH